MIISGIDMSPFTLSVAASLARMDSGAQAAFFNVFAKELRAACGTSYNAEMQAAHVMREVSPEFKEFCAMIAFKE